MPPMILPWALNLFYGRALQGRCPEKHGVASQKIRSSPKSIRSSRTAERMAACGKWSDKTGSIMVAKSRPGAQLFSGDTTF